jgi:plastocyanin
MWQLLALLTGGTISGSVHLDGPRPAMAELRRDSDPFCAKTRMRSEEVVGNLANVMVRVSGAPPSAPPRERAILEQVNCRYSPHVSGIVAGQDVEIVNRDPTLHNVHTYSGTQTYFCMAQLAGQRTFTPARAGSLIKIKCDVHPWMSAYVWVHDNPLFAVTSDDGSFMIRHVPFGIWTVRAWHERFGERTAQVLVLPWIVSRVDFRY